MESFRKLLLLSILAAAAANSSWDCPSPCRCSWILGKKAANCSNVGYFYMPTFLTNLGGHTEFQVIDLTGNNLTEISKHDFTGADMLQKLILSDCKLVSIHKQWHVSLDLLYHLDLSKNFLTTLDKETFQRLPSLRVISLNNNQLEVLEDGLFSDMFNLIRVDLSYNKIIEIGVNTFRNVPEIRMLKLDNNKLEYLNVDILKPLTSLTGLDLYDNPWHCHCKLQELVTWIAQNFDNPRLSCAEPAVMRGKQWKHLESDDFVCESKVVDVVHPTDTPRVTTTSTIAPIESANAINNLTCQVNGNPLPTLHWKPHEHWEVKYYVCGDYLCVAKTVKERVVRLPKTPPSV